MKKSILAIIATISIGATGMEAHQAHAAENNQSSQQSYSESNESTSSVYQEFIDAGGTKALWDSIVIPESGGNPNASNQSWGYGSVENQTKGMINYAKERYGSIDKAISFREANGYW